MKRVLGLPINELGDDPGCDMIKVKDLVAWIETQKATTIVESIVALHYSLAKYVVTGEDVTE